MCFSRSAQFHRVWISFGGVASLHMKKREMWDVQIFANFLHHFFLTSSNIHSFAMLAPRVSFWFCQDTHFSLFLHVDEPQLFWSVFAIMDFPVLSVLFCKYSTLTSGAIENGMDASTDFPSLLLNPAQLNKIISISIAQNMNYKEFTNLPATQFASLTFLIVGTLHSQLTY